MTAARTALRGLGKYWAVWRVTVRSQLAYLPELLWRTLFMVVIIYILTQLWRVTYSGAGASSLAGLTLPHMIWYLVVTESLILSRPRQIGIIDGEVKGGDIAYRLNRPYHYLLYHYSTFLAEALLRVVVNLTVGSLIALALVGPIRIHLWSVPVFLAGALFGLTMEFLIHMCIGLGAFWVEDTSAFAWVYDKLLFILGGMLMPIDLFPGIIRRISLVLPMNYIVYRPAKALVALAPGHAASMLLGQLVWLTALGLSAILIYRAGVKRVNVNGG